MGVRHRNSNRAILFVGSTETNVGLAVITRHVVFVSVRERQIDEPLSTNSRDQIIRNERSRFAQCFQNYRDIAKLLFG